MNRITFLWESKLLYVGFPDFNETVLMAWNYRSAWRIKRRTVGTGGRGAIAPPNLGKSSTYCKQEGADYVTTLLLPPPLDFQTFLRTWNEGDIKKLIKMQMISEHMIHLYWAGKFKVFWYVWVYTMDSFQIGKGPTSIDSNLRLKFWGTAFSLASLHLFHIKWHLF